MAALLVIMKGVPMSRKERRKEPALTPKEQVELSQKNIPLRIVLVVLALVLVAAIVAKAVAKPDLKNTTVMENS